MSRFCVFVMFIALFSAACSSGGGNEVGELPTVFVIPTLEPSATPTDTLTPTETNTPTNTPTNTATRTPTPTPTRTATVFVPPTETPIQPTATPSITPTPTLAPPTATQTLVVTLSTAQIITFSASATTAITGGQVTLSWSAVADTVRLERLNAQGIVVETFNDLPQQGSQVITTPSGQGATIIYRLVARRGTDEKTATQQITLTGTTTCSTPWFFPNPPTDAGCPSGAATAASGAYQPFEKGVMIYHTANGQNTVYALANAGGFLTQNTYSRQTSMWDNASTFANYLNASGSFCTTSPVAPQIEPQQMFAWMYCMTFAPFGSWIDALGWATGTLVTDPQLNIQSDSSGVMYIETPNGEIYRLEPIQQGNTGAAWTKIR